MSLSTSTPSASLAQSTPILPAAQSSYGIGMGKGANGGTGNAEAMNMLQQGIYGTAADANEGLGRGEMTGDHCFTIDLFAQRASRSVGRSVTVSTWAEKRNRCTINMPSSTSSNITDDISFSHSGRTFLQSLSENQALSSSNLSHVFDIVTGVSADVKIGSVDKSKTDLERSYAGYLVDEFIDFFTGEPVAESSLNLPEVELALALLLLRCIVEVTQEKEKELEKERAEDSSKSKGKGKGRSGKGANKGSKLTCSLILLVPCNLSQQQGFLLYSAATRAAAYHSALVSAGTVSSSFQYMVRGMLNRGVSSVAGALSLPALQAFRAALRSRKEDTEDNEPLVLYFRLQQDPKNFEAALIRCEGGLTAVKSGNLLGFDRLATLATISGYSGLSDQSDASECAKYLSVALSVLMKRAKLSQNETLPIAVLVEASGSNLFASEKLKKDMQQAATSSCKAQILAWQWLEASSLAAVGGCLLSAAELDSSKQYLLQKSRDRDGGDKWYIAYQLPIADGCVLSEDIGLRVDFVDSSPDDLSDQNVRLLFPSGSRLWKADIGPLRPNCALSGLQPVKLEFQWRTMWSYLVGPIWRLLTSFWGKGGSLKPSSEAWMSNPAKHKQELSWPKVRIFERVGATLDLTKVSDGELDPNTPPQWRLIKTFTPLAAAATTDKEKGKGKEDSEKNLDLVDCSDITISPDPNTGLVKVVDCKGPTLSEIQKVRQMWVMLLLLLLLPMMLFLLWQAWGWVSDQYALRMQVYWLQDFYRTHAPEKLKDPSYVVKTIAKYKGRMFLLWRNLEKAYKVKWPAPYGAVEL